MIRIHHIADLLNHLAPLRLAEEWDNVGLLVGDASLPAERVMTCLTITPESAAEAIERSADLIVVHHPLPFKPLKRLTTDTTASKLLWDLIRAGVSVYSPHTGFDSAACGINQALANKIGLADVKPLVPIIADPDSLGAGRVGKLSLTTLSELIAKIKQAFCLDHLQFVGDLKSNLSCVAVACGSGGSFLAAARRNGCDTLVTGETTFHTCLEASAQGVSMILLGHFVSERFALDNLADRIRAEFTDLEVWASERESDPVRWG